MTAPAPPRTIPGKAEVAQLVLFSGREACHRARGGDAGAGLAVAQVRREAAVLRHNALRDLRAALKAYRELRQARRIAVGWNPANLIEEECGR
jgi:hypothetical protein